MNGDPGASAEVRPAEGRSWSGLLSTAERIGHHVWVERALFSWLGAWSGAAPHPGAAVFLGEQAARHGWHAEVMFQRLPELREVEPEHLVRPGGPAAKEFVASVCTSSDEPDLLLEALVGHYRVLLPALIGSYRSLVADASVVADPALIRWAGFVLTDDLDEWARGDALTRTLLDDSTKVRGAAARQGELESLLLGCDRFPC